MLVEQEKVLIAKLSRAQIRKVAALRSSLTAWQEAQAAADAAAAVTAGEANVATDTPAGIATPSAIGAPQQQAEITGDEVAGPPPSPPSPPPPPKVIMLPSNRPAMTWSNANLEALQAMGPMLAKALLDQLALKAKWQLHRQEPGFMAKAAARSRLYGTNMATAMGFCAHGGAVARGTPASSAPGSPRTTAGGAAPGGGAGWGRPVVPTGSRGNASGSAAGPASPSSNRRSAAGVGRTGTTSAAGAAHTSSDNPQQPAADGDGANWDNAPPLFAEAMDVLCEDVDVTLANKNKPVEERVKALKAELAKFEGFVSEDEEDESEVGSCLCHHVLLTAASVCFSGRWHVCQGSPQSQDVKNDHSKLFSLSTFPFVHHPDVRRTRAIGAAVTACGAAPALAAQQAAAA